MDTRLSCNSAHAATIGSVLKVSCNRPTRVVFVIGRVSCKPKIGGALKQDLTPAASTTSERSAMLAHPSTELVARVPCQLRHSHARPVRPRARASASSAALRSTRRASAAFKRGASQGPSSRDAHAGFFFFGGGFP